MTARDFKAFGADIQKRLTDLETSAATILTQATADTLYLGIHATADKAAKLTLAANAVDATVPLIVQTGTSTDELTAGFDADLGYNPVSKTLFVTNVNSANVVKSLSLANKMITVTQGNGTTSTITLPDTVYEEFTGATADADGAAGLVPAPVAGKVGQVLTSNGSWADDIAGNAGSATKLATARNIGVEGALTAAAVAFDGTADISINVTTVDGTKVAGVVPQAEKDADGNIITETYATKAEVAGAYHFKGTVNTVADLPTDNVVEGDVYNIGASLDGDNYVAHFDTDKTLQWDKLGGTVDLSAYLTKADAVITYLGINDTAKAAEKLANVRTIKFTGGATGSFDFDGSSDITVELSTINADKITEGTLDGGVLE